MGRSSISTARFHLRGSMRVNSKFLARPVYTMLALLFVVNCIFVHIYDIFMYLYTHIRKQLKKEGKKETREESLQGISKKNF